MSQDLNLTLLPELSSLDDLPDGASNLNLICILHDKGVMQDIVVFHQKDFIVQFSLKLIHSSRAPTGSEFENRTN